MDKCEPDEDPGWLGRQIEATQREVYETVKTPACSIFNEHEKCKRGGQCDCRCHQMSVR